MRVDYLVFEPGGPNFEVIVKYSLKLGFTNNSDNESFIIHN